jgi:hypothetical protein
MFNHEMHVGQVRHPGWRPYSSATSRRARPLAVQIGHNENRPNLLGTACGLDLNAKEDLVKGMPVKNIGLSQGARNLNSTVLFLFTAIALSWGQSFVPPFTGLEPGWKEALVQATDQGLGFGTDLVFTFGPYHQLYTNAISDNLHPFVIGRLVYGLAWGAAVISLVRLSTPAAGWLLALFMALCGSLSNDAPFYALQLAFLLIVASDIQQRELPLIALIYAGIVISVFCKLSFAVSAVAIVFCAAWLLARKFLHTLKQAVLALAVVLGIPLMIWEASGQSIVNLWHFLLGPNLSIVLGYSSAMAIDDPAIAWQIPAFWVGAFNVAALILRTSYFRLKNRVSSVFITCVSLFLFWTVFKAGMVRHDQWHALSAGLALACFAVLAVIYTTKIEAHEIQFVSAAGSLVLGLSISSKYVSPLSSEQWIENKLGNLYLFSKILPSSRARQSIQGIRQNGFSRIMKDAEDLSLIPKASSVDSMPWDITDIPANGLLYRPRPIIQSYSAYTPSLQELNRKHFLGKQAPSYLVMNSQSIDGRNHPDLDYPSLEAIASKYQIIGTGSKGSLILKQNNRYEALTRYAQWQETRLGLEGDEARVANSVKERWSQLPKQLAPGSRYSLVLKPSLWRRLQTLVFKSSPLIIAVKFEDGQIRTYRVLEETSQKIPLFPYVESNTGLRSYMLALQGFPVDSLDMGSKPLAIRLVGVKGDQGLQSCELMVEQPRFQ